MTQSIRIALASGQSLFREAVRSVLEREEGVEVVAEAKEGVQAVSDVERTRADVAIVDADLPNADGFRTTAMIKERVPDCRVLLIDDEEDHEGLHAAVLAGARGYLTKGAPISELIDAARAIVRGETRVPALMLGGLLTRLVRFEREQSEALRKTASLTRREREVLALLVRGGDKHDIARTLVISPETARTHVQNVLGKLGAHSRLEAVAIVTRNGLAAELEMARDDVRVGGG